MELKIDERYKRGQIYTIRNYTDDTMIYVGSTINTLSKRFEGHRLECKQEKKNCVSLYNNIIDNDWTNWYIELYEDFPCNNKKELERQEGIIIRQIGTINKNIAGRTVKEWRVENRKCVLEQQTKWRIEHSNKVKEHTEKYRVEHADRVKESAAKYYIKNKEQIKQYKADNKEKIKEQMKQYRLKKKLEKEALDSI